jgi:hypothetical protein
LAGWTGQRTKWPPTSSWSAAAATIPRLLYGGGSGRRRWDDESLAAANTGTRRPRRGRAAFAALNASAERDQVIQRQSCRLPAACALSCGNATSGIDHGRPVGAPGAKGPPAGYRRTLDPFGRATEIIFVRTGRPHQAARRTGVSPRLVSTVDSLTARMTAKPCRRQPSQPDKNTTSPVGTRVRQSF